MSYFDWILKSSGRVVLCGPCQRVLYEISTNSGALDTSCAMCGRRYRVRFELSRDNAEVTFLDKRNRCRLRKINVDFAIVSLDHREARRIPPQWNPFSDLLPFYWPRAFDLAGGVLAVYGFCLRLGTVFDWYDKSVQGFLAFLLFFPVFAFIIGGFCLALFGGSAITWYFRSRIADFLLPRWMGRTHKLTAESNHSAFQNLATLKWRDRQARDQIRNQVDLYRNLQDCAVQAHNEMLRHKLNNVESFRMRISALFPRYQAAIAQLDELGDKYESSIKRYQVELELLALTADGSMGLKYVAGELTAGVGVYDWIRDRISHIRDSRSKL